MPFGDRGWRDSTENYADGYTLKINGSTATAVLANSYSQPVALIGISVSLNPSIGSGAVDIRDSSATGDADPTVWGIVIASAASQNFNHVALFPRPMALNNGIVITATSCTGTISLIYKPRYN